MSKPERESESLDRIEVLDHWEDGFPLFKARFQKSGQSFVVR